MKKRKILFLGETYRADAITWMNGLKQFGDFEIITWELKTPSYGGVNRILRLFEYCFAYYNLKKIIKLHNPDMVISERTTSYGFLAALTGVKPIAIAQQGLTDLWPSNSILLPLKKQIQNYAFKKADLIHAWGPIMVISMEKTHVDIGKVLQLSKGIDLTKFTPKNIEKEYKIKAIVTRSLLPEYCHDIILKSFAILHKKGIDFSLTIIGDGLQLNALKDLTKKLQLNEKVKFTGRIPNSDLPTFLHESNIYISMPTTEGVSSSLFEAMATNCYPIVTDLPGNRSWINHRENGQLVTVNDCEMLASEIIWAFENQEFRHQAIKNNLEFIKQNGDYNINMKVIATKYHELINSNNQN